MFLGKFARKFKFDLLQKLPLGLLCKREKLACLLLLRALPRNDFFNIEEI